MFAITSQEETYTGYSYMIFKEIYITKGFNSNNSIACSNFLKKYPFKNKRDLIKMLKKNWNKMVII